MVVHCDVAVLLYCGDGSQDLHALVERHIVSG